MEHCVACRRNVDTAGAFTRINGVDSDVDNLDTNLDHKFDRDWWLWGAYAQATTIDRARLRQPHWLFPRNMEIWPVERGTVPPEDPNFMDLRGYELDIKHFEALTVEGIETGAGAEDLTAVLFLWDKQRTIRQPIRTIGGNGVFILHASSTTAAVAGAWSTLTMVYDEEPPTGTYQIQGFVHRSATGIAARLIRQGSSQYRPGSISIQTNGQRTAPVFMEEERDLGLIGTLQMPRFEVLCTAADAAHDLWVKMIKTSDQVQLAA